MLQKYGNMLVWYRTQQISHPASFTFFFFLILSYLSKIISICFIFLSFFLAYRPSLILWECACMFPFGLLFKFQCSLRLYEWLKDAQSKCFLCCFSVPAVNSHFCTNASAERNCSFLSPDPSVGWWGSVTSFVRSEAECVKSNRRVFIFFPPYCSVSAPCMMCRHLMVCTVIGAKAAEPLSAPTVTWAAP